MRTTQSGIDAGLRRSSPSARSTGRFAVAGFVDAYGIPERANIAPLLSSHFSPSPVTSSSRWANALWGPAKLDKTQFASGCIAGCANLGHAVPDEFAAGELVRQWRGSGSRNATGRSSQVGLCGRTDCLSRPLRMKFEAWRKSRGPTMSNQPALRCQPVASRGAAAHAGRRDQNAAIPVCARPRISACTSCVPS